MEDAEAVWWVNQFAVTPDHSGGTRHYDLAAELRRQGIDVHLVASDLSLYTRVYEVRRAWWDPRPHRQLIDGVPFHWLPAGVYRANDWRRAASMAVFAVAVLGYLVTRRMGRRAVVIGSSPHLLGALAAWMAAKVRRLPFILEVRDLWPESFTAVSGAVGGVQVKLMRWISDFLYRRSDHIIVLADGSRGVIEARGADAESITWIPNGVDTTTFPIRSSVSVTRPVRFVYAGAHGPANGLEVVVEAAADVGGRGRDDVEVVFIGDGPAKDELIQLAERLGAPVSFWDPVPKSQIPSALGSCDVGLMVLADVELFTYGVSPNKLFDYFAADLPVLTNVPGFVGGLVDDAGAGLCVAPGSPSALAEGMAAMADRLQEDPEVWRTGRQYVEQRFDRRMLAKECWKVIEGARG